MRIGAQSQGRTLIYYTKKTYAVHTDIDRYDVTASQSTKYAET